MSSSTASTPWDSTVSRWTSARSSSPSYRASAASRSSTATPMWSMRSNMRRGRLGGGFQARVRPDPAADLGARAAVDLDDVGGEVVLPTQQRGAHAVGVDRHAARLEVADLVRGEAARHDDVHALVTGGVERLAHLLDELGLHPAQVPALQ